MHVYIYIYIYIYMYIYIYIYIHTNMSPPANQPRRPVASSGPGHRSQDAIM